jgi:hypothetical protein
MPLLTPKYQTDLKTGLTPLIIETTKNASQVAGKKAFYDAMVKFRDESKKAIGPDGKIKENVFEEADEAASKVFADTFSDLFSKEMAKLADNISAVVSAKTEAYLKAADIYYTVPIGTLTIGAGAAAVPNPVPIPFVYSPTNPASLGGIK